MTFLPLVKQEYNCSVLNYISDPNAWELQALLMAVYDLLLSVLGEV